jgi:H+/Cl- antiporter ClcA
VIVLLAVLFRIFARRRLFSSHPRSSGTTRWPYREGVVVPARAAALRWMLLSVLAFALIGMHSLVTTHAADTHAASSGMVAALVEPPAPAGSAAFGMVDQVTGPTDAGCCPDHDPAMNHSGSSGQGHDLRHLCLAVLVALAGLVLGWLLWRRARTTPDRQDPNPAVARVGRGPPRARPAPDLLSSLCVLRL